MAHITVNFAVEDHIGPPRNFKYCRLMEFLIMLIVFPAWLIQALKDGGKVK